MSDLIDRQALLKQIDIDSDGEPGYYGDTWKFIDTIKSMPPAELSTNLAEVGTDVPDNNVGELISRKQAIDAVRATLLSWSYMPEWRDNKIIEAVKRLPPAQPETTHRIVGKSKGGMTLWYECERCGEPVDEGDKFCRGCGAKMEVNHESN